MPATKGSVCCSRRSYDSKRTMEAFGLMRKELKHIRKINADMLDALQHVLSAMDSDIVGTSHLSATDKLHLAARAYAAITKATGGDNDS